jgi:flagellar basal body-associated protein FliL
VPPKKSRKTLWIIIALVVVICCCGGGIGGGFFFYSRVTDQTTAISDAAKSFFTAVVDNGNAYDQLCSSAKASISRGQFQQGLQSSPLKSFNVAGVNLSTDNGTTKATVTAQLTYSDRAETRIVPMRDDGDGWKVCGDPY